jgi:hypothetical protein
MRGEGELCPPSLKTLAEAGAKEGARGGTMDSPALNDWEGFAVRNGLRLRELLCV